MRTYDIAYVSNGVNNYYPAKPLQDMTLEEIRKKYIKTCAKANGEVSVCSKCSTPCPEGKRAIQLIANEVYNDPPIPLYGGKTLIERAKEENEKRRAELEEAGKALAEAQKAIKEKEEKNDVIEKRVLSNRIYIDNWYEKAVASGDPIKWVMKAYNISELKAKQKLWDRRYRMKKEGKEIPEEIKEEKKEEVKEPVDSNLESKLEALMKKQEEYKKQMDNYMKLYNQAKDKYGELKKKADILCNAMDILNE